MSGLRPGHSSGQLVAASQLCTEKPTKEMQARRQIVHHNIGARSDVAVQPTVPGRDKPICLRRKPLVGLWPSNSMLPWSVPVIAQGRVTFVNWNFSERR